MIFGLTMFIVFLVLLLIGFPVSFSMIISTLIALFMGGYSLEVFTTQVIEGIKGYTLLAVPLFILAGNLMNSAGITQRIFDFLCCNCRVYPWRLGTSEHIGECHFFRYFRYGCR